MGTTKFGWDNTVSGAIDIEGQYNTTLDQIDSDIKTVRDHSDPYIIKQEYTGPLDLPSGTTRNLTGDTSWPVVYERGLVGSVSRGTDEGRWLFSEGLWYCRYQLTVTGSTNIASGKINCWLADLNAGDSLLQASVCEAPTEVTYGITTVTRGFYFKSVVGGSLLNGEVDPTHHFNLSPTQFNSGVNTLDIESTGETFIQFQFISSIFT